MTRIRRGTAAVVAVCSAALLAGVAPTAGAAAVPAPGPAAAAPAGPPVPPAPGRTQHALTADEVRALPQPSVAPGASRATIARAFAVQNSRALGLTGDLGPARSLSAVGGGSVVRFDQTVGGVPVMGGQVVVDLDADGTVRGALSETLPGDAPATTPAVTAASAAATARTVAARSHGGSAGLVAATPELTIFDPQVLGAPGLPGAKLAWRTEVTSRLRPDVRQLVVVDATRGTVLLSVDQTAEGKSRTVCDANNVRGAGVPCTRPVRRETGAASAVADVEDAFTLAGDVYDYYKTSFGRDSIDGQGMPIVSTVRYCDPDARTSCPLDNAFWNGTQMVYGEGFASADDVVAHELTHGVTEKTSGLFYFYESGAINESISDIFGEYVDQRFATLTPDAADTKWLLGEDLPASIGVIRNMKNPPAFGQPDATNSPLFLSGTGQFGADGDSGAVHTNSGVGNKFAYLLTDGDTFNGVAVAGLGRAKAQTIIYAATQRLTSAADYQAFASALKLGCASVVGTAGIKQIDCAQVGKAITATKMDQPPPARGFGAAPATCVNHPGQEATAVFSDNFEDNASGKWDRAGFYYADQENPFSSVGWVPKYATSGKNNVWGDDSTSTNSEMTLTLHAPVKVPANGYLKFKHAFSFDSDIGQVSDQFYDGGLIEYATAAAPDNWTPLANANSVNGYNGTLTAAGTNPRAGETAFVYTSRGYQTSLFDLSGLAGESVRLRFTLATDASFGSYGWFLDDVQVGGCHPPETTKPILKAGALSTVSITSPVVTATATDASGIAGYVVKRRWAGPRVGFTSWTAGTFRAGKTLRWVEPYVEGRTTCFSIQAKDTKGNLSAAQMRCTTSPWDDYKLTRSPSGWTVNSSASAYDSTLSISKKAGSTLVVTGVSGTSMVLLARKGVGAGTVSVWVGKTRKAVFSLSATSTVSKVRLPVATGVFTQATITIKVDAPGTAGVAIDGLAIRRA